MILNDFVFNCEPVFVKREDHISLDEPKLLLLALGAWNSLFLL